jgi:hypothetical protein
MLAKKEENPPIISFGMYGHFITQGSSAKPELGLNFSNFGQVQNFLID